MWYSPGYLDHVGLVLLYATEKGFHGSPGSNNILRRGQTNSTGCLWAALKGFSSRQMSLVLINNASQLELPSN